MSTAEAMTNLTDLATVSKELNAKSNQANQILMDLEKKLVAMNLGVEAWLSKDPLQSEPSVEDWEDGNGEWKESKFRTDEVLGFGRLGDRFCLLVKKVTYEEDFLHGGWKVKEEKEPSHLLQASRQLRIEALSKIEPLLDRLVKEAKRIVGLIDQGRKTVDNL